MRKGLPSDSRAMTAARSIARQASLASDQVDGQFPRLGSGQRPNGDVMLVEPGRGREQRPPALQKRAGLDVITSIAGNEQPARRRRRDEQPLSRTRRYRDLLPLQIVDRDHRPRVFRTGVTGDPGGWRMRAPAIPAHPESRPSAAARGSGLRPETAPGRFESGTEHRERRQVPPPPPSGKCSQGTRPSQSTRSSRALYGIGSC